MEEWVERTNSWIHRWKVTDSSGQLHRPHGIWTSRAHITVYVLFDGHPIIGQRAHYIFTEPLKRFVYTLIDCQPVLATLGPSSKITNTGAGYLVSLRSVFIDRVEKIGAQPTDDSDHAVRLVTEQLERRDFLTRPATLKEQMLGVDVVAKDKLPVPRYGRIVVPHEMKSRTKRQEHERIFVQISETNPEGRV